MFYIIRHTFNSTFKSMRSLNSIVFKAYFCDKKEIILKKLNEEKESDQEPGEKTREEIEAFLFENEEKILQTVTVEKERDANVRSRLSKECNKLLDKKIRLTSTGLHLHLDPNVTKNTCWEDYMFESTIDNLKKHTHAATVESTSKGVCVAVPIKKPPTKRHSDDKQPPTPPGTRIIRSEPGKVLFAFIPEEWFHFFVPKTGVTGFGTFLFTVGIYLLSKEYYVLEHNYYNGLGMVAIFYGGIKYVGPHLAKYLDKEVDEYEKAWQKGRDTSRAVLEEQIEDEKLMQFQCEGQLLLVDAKRKNVQLQLEEEFRIRQMVVYREVLKRLNYNVAVAEIYRRIFHRNLVDYVTREVMKSITPEMEKEMFNLSVSFLVAELEERISAVQ